MNPSSALSRLLLATLASAILSSCAGGLQWRRHLSAKEVEVELRSRGIDTMVILQTSFYNWDEGEGDQNVVAWWLEKGRSRRTILSREESSRIEDCDHILIDYALLNEQAVTSANLVGSWDEYDSVQGRMRNRTIIRSDGLHQQFVIGIGNRSSSLGFGMVELEEPPLALLNGLASIAAFYRMAINECTIDTTAGAAPAVVLLAGSTAALRALHDSLRHAGIDTMVTHSLRGYDWQSRNWVSQHGVVWVDSNVVYRRRIYDDGEYFDSQHGDRLAIDLFLFNDSLLSAAEYDVDPSHFDTTRTTDRFPAQRMSERGDASVTLQLGQRVVAKRRPSWCIRENSVSRAYLQNLSSPLHTWMLIVEESAP